MSEFKFLVVVIVILELIIFSCGVCVVRNRHHARQIFIELEHEQQIHHALKDEETRLLMEVSNLEQNRKVEQLAKEKGLVPAKNDQVLIIEKKLDASHGGRP